MFKYILIPTDGSPASETAALRGIDMAASRLLDLGSRGANDEHIYIW